MIRQQTIYRPSPKVLRNGRLVPRYGSAAPAAAPAADIPDDGEAPAPATKASGGAKFMIALFLLSLIIPLSGAIGTVRLTPYAVYFLVTILPFFGMWLAQSRTKIILPDVMILLYWAWAAGAVIYNHGFEPSAEGIGMHFLQTFGAYLAGRMLIRDYATMRYFAKAVVFVIAAMLPLVVAESLTGQKVILKAASALGSALQPVIMDKRMGLTRAQGAFEHPILMGVFCASLLSIAYYSLLDRKSFIRSAFNGAIVVVSAVLSLSTGALLLLNVQFGLMAWSYLLRNVEHRWSKLGILLCSTYIAIDVVSNRTPFHVFVSYGTFSTSSSYNRILIWQFGSAEALRHPLLGIGFHEWERPAYMSGSMDNFWLVQAVRYGIPAFLLLAGAALIIMKRVGQATMPDRHHAAMRQGMLFSLVAICVAVVSVHLWNAAYVWFCFLLGACAWPMFLNAPAGQQPASARAEPEGFRPGQRALRRKLGRA